MAQLNFRLSDELAKQYKVWLAKNERTMKEHLEETILAEVWRMRFNERAKEELLDVVLYEEELETVENLKAESWFQGRFKQAPNSPEWCSRFYEITKSGSVNRWEKEEIPASGSFVLEVTIDEAKNRGFRLFFQEGKKMATRDFIQKKLFKSICEERKNWDNEDLEPAIVAVLDREDNWVLAYELIPETWLDENREEIEGYVDTYGDADSFDRWAVILWLFSEFGEEYTTL